jgi:4'-phosphopantetheinyl transferase
MLGPSAPESTTALLWPSAPSEVRLTDHEIHLWCAALGDFQRELPRLESTLSLDERVRASRFRSFDDRDAFVICRGILRELLGQYLGRDAATITFSYGQFGKPDLTGLPDHSRLYFNASRSGALAVYAVTSACPVGVDVERLRPVLDFQYLASRFFTRFEAEWLKTLSPDRQMEGFFECWTCKEAFVKATGEGIGRGLRSVHVDPDAHACPCVGDDAHLPGTWQVQSLRPADGYVGAVAHWAEDARLLHLRVSDSLLNRR